MIWRCPYCRSKLAKNVERLSCTSCAQTFEIISGIPDLRVDVDTWVDHGADLAFARALAAKDQPLEAMVRAVYSARADYDSARIERRTREVLDAPRLLQKQVSGWLDRATASGPVLDLGCGSGPTMIALLSAGRACIGVDVSMTWLVVAQRMISHAGYTPVLAAAVAEALPLAEDALGAVVSLDVIEHVRNVPLYVQEINRAVRPGGYVAISTPNRYSLSAEPHVFVWGVGWLPRRWQKRFVHWRSGKNYDDTVLMSYRELRSQVKRNSDFSISIRIPSIPSDHILQFSPTKAAVARFYNQLVRFGALDMLFFLVGPFFQMTGIKNVPFGRGAAPEG